MKKQTPAQREWVRVIGSFVGKHRPISQREVEERSKKLGVKVVQKTVSNATGERANPQLRVIEGICRALDIPVWAALVPELPDNMLTIEALQKLDSLVRGFINADPAGREVIVQQARYAAAQAAAKRRDGVRERSTDHKKGASGQLITKPNPDHKPRH